MATVYLYNPFSSDYIEGLIDQWIQAEKARGWTKDLVRVRHGEDKPLTPLARGDTLYIIGHGDVQANRICDRTPQQGSNPEILTPEQLAVRLKGDGLTDKPIKIKIYSCLAAQGVLDSFAKNAAVQIKLKIGGMGGLSCKFTIYGYREIVSVLINHPTQGYGKFIGELKKDVNGTDDVVDLTEKRASSSREVLITPGLNIL